MCFWFGDPTPAEKLEAVRRAENKLLEFARAKFDGRQTSDYELRVVETDISRDSVSVKSHGCDVYDEVGSEATSYKMHAIHVENRAENGTRNKTPLVLLHGYMNGAAYFYRNIIGLSSGFQSVYSVDMLGWGLSSRPKFEFQNDSLEAAEDFFVESLEAWRKSNGIDRMILTGHSMGGYLSVAYAERYPERVEQLVLASAVGIPEETPEMAEQRISRRKSSLHGRAVWAFWSYCFTNKTPGEVIRMFPKGRGLQIVQGYVERRLPAIETYEEQHAVADYLYKLATSLPASGEYCVNKFLTASVHARRPLVHRIPNLRVPRVSFLYGKKDWMDSQGGLDVQQACESQANAPKVSVYEVKNAGHLLMLDNWKWFNAGVVLATAGTVADTSQLILLQPASNVSEESTEVAYSDFRQSAENEENASRASS